ncbi:fibroblast growth factor receptor substrate 2 [Diorhabda sublineata]|uniref:fibroblast growth factor receptor substrate 2 n=1 Tax=Diorhabda sublineata TaxID=1163346 RepID=UPI0024E09042|nr:fibroblast growth factor receptor substrate 2 [Diorhabda sublineata]
MKMGCVSSKSDINDRHPNIFQVTNVDDQGKKIKPGKLQVTETDLIFYQRGKKPTKWPLRALRKYGCDTDIFSFECGRRCPTGHGIYAFKCKKAELLFNIVQQYITGNLADESNPNDSLANGQLLVTRRPNLNNIFQVQTEGYLNPISVPPVSRPIVGNSRPGSVGSNGPLSPTLSPPLQVETPTEHNNNKRGSLVPEPTYTNSLVLDSSLMLPQYINMGSSEVTEVSGPSRLYMNVDMPEEPEERHCYANIDTEDLEVARPPDTTLIPYVSVDPNVVEEVNYAELDLNGDGDRNSNAPTVVPEGPSIKEKYVTIDFQKTTALSQSINPNMTVEEGCRKTRHNSTINYHSSVSD